MRDLLRSAIAARIRWTTALVFVAGFSEASVAQTLSDSAKRLLDAGRNALEQRTTESLPRALELNRSAATLFRRGGDRPGEAEALMQVALARLYLGAPPDSVLAELRHADTLSRAAGAVRVEASIAEAFGEVYGQTSDLTAALASYRSAQALMTRARDDSGVAEAINNVGTVQYRQGQNDSALATFERAYSLGRRLGSIAVQGSALGNMAAVLEDLGHKDSALALYRSSLGLRRQAADRMGEVVVLNNIGYLFHSRGRLDSARVYYRRAADALTGLGAGSAEASILTNLGAIERRTGRTASARNYYRRALKDAQNAGDRETEAVILDDLGLVYADLERRDSALAYTHASLGLARDVTARTEELRALNNIGSIFESMKDLDSAATYLSAARDLARALNDSVDEATILSNLALIQFDRGHVDSAMIFVRRGYAIGVEVGDSSSRSSDLLTIGSLYERMKQPDSARVYYLAALEIARAVESKLSERTALENIGFLFHRGSRPDLRRALAYYDSAAAVIASFRRETASDMDRLAFAEGAAGLYDTWALAWLGRTDLPPRSRALASLAAAERGRARALLDLLHHSAASPVLGADLVAEGAGLVARLRSPVLSYLATEDTLLVWLALPSGEIVAEQCPVRRDSLAALISKLRVGLGVDGQKVGGRSGDALDAGLELQPGSLVERGVEADSLRSDAWERPAAALSELLLPPRVARHLPRGGELVIVPQGVLALVPFQLLIINSSAVHLGERYALRYGPSLTSVRELDLPYKSVAVPFRSDAVLVVGNPTMPIVMSAGGRESALRSLPGAESEARFVAQRWGVEPLLGSHATESEVRRRLPTARIVHLATHGYAYASDVRARDSFVALAPDSVQDGLLTVGELLDDPALTLSAELVVLSACQTGLGDVKRAEGTVGLQRAFLAKGARSLLVSLWSVSDEATRLLMERFYDHWLLDSDVPGKAEALRRAQTDVRKRKQFEHPRFWAAFQLVGAG